MALHAGGEADVRQLAQLKILYNARGRKLEELTQQLTQARDEGDREIRILAHQAALKEGGSSAAGDGRLICLVVT